MKHAKSILWLTAAVAVIAIFTGLPAVARAACPGDVDFSGVPVVTPGDLDNTATLNALRDQRAAAAYASSICLPLAFPDGCGRRDFGQAFHHRLFAYLASTDQAKKDQAYAFLLGIQRSDMGSMGTTAPLGDFCETTLEDVVGFLPNLATNLGRHGEADIAMIGLVTALQMVPPTRGDVIDHVLSLIDQEPTIGGVETVSFGLSAVTIGSICALSCATACGGGPIACGICVGACALALDGESIDAPETENHLNNIYVSQYLANQKRFERTHNAKYDNARNGYRARMLARMRDFVRNDFIEYNALPYQRYSMFALLALASFATDTAVQEAAKNALNYVSAKVAVSGNDFIRSVPFRRRNEPEHSCDNLYLGCEDPHSHFYPMLTGVTDVFPGKFAPGGFVEDFAWVAATNYKIDDVILDLFVDKSHRKFYQYFRYGRVLQFDGFADTNEELYFGSPSFLLSAGGRPAHYAYTATVPFPIDLFPFVGGRHPGSQVDIGAVVPTTLMPTGDPGRSHTRSKMISFFEPNGENLCVGPNFACGLGPNVPADYPNKVPDADVNAVGLDPAHWTVFDRKGSAGPYGYFVAVYRQEDFGFLEVYDTFKNTPPLADVHAFMQKVHDNNPGATFSRSDVNTYHTVDGTKLQFLVDARIVSINDVAPDRSRTNGDVIDNDGNGTVTIKNPVTGKSITLNATIPPTDPSISVPGPVRFPNTCVGTTSYQELDICNVNTAGDGLFVYNITPKNTQIGAIEPTSGYPLSVSHDFCYPFQVSYTPTVYGTFTSSFTVSNSDPEQGELRVDVTGAAPPGTIAVTGALNFGDVCAGTFRDLNLTINDSGACPLSLSNITSDSSLFATTTTLSYPLNIAPGTSTAVPVRFNPTSFGPQTANITIASNDPSSPTKVVAFSGNAPPPLASTSGALDFGQLCVGVEKTKTVKVCDTGKCNLSVTGASLQGAQCAGLEIVNPPTYPLTISPDFCFDFNVKFKPQAPQAVSNCSLVVATDDPAHPTLSFPITASVGAPNLVLDPPNLNGTYAFPATVIDPNGSLACFSDRTIVVRNNGTCPATITAIAATAPYKVVAPIEFPVTLPVGQETLTVTTRFKPTADGSGQTVPGSTTGTLSLSSTYGGPQPSKNADLCGEAVSQSGARVLVVDSANNPITGLDSLTLTGKGVNTPSPISISLKNVSPTTTAVCGNTVTYHLDTENLPPTQTTGSNPRSSYTVGAKEKNKQVTQSFSLGQCEFKQFILKLQ